MSSPPTPIEPDGKMDLTGRSNSSLFDSSIGTLTTSFDEDSVLEDQKGFVYPLTPQEQRHESSNEKLYNHYPLESEQLQRYVLSPSVFGLRLNERLGTGANSYVYGAVLTTHGGNSFEVAVKIPVSKNRVKSLERETLFMMKLAKYRQELGVSSANYPFIDPYGLYYLNRDSFAMMRKRDELPCLVMKKMDMTLSDYIRRCRASAQPEHVVIGQKCWWRLCGTLLKSLEILRALRAVHCDLKTDNVMLLEPDGFKVSDFSSAQSTNSAKECQSTLQFTAPELLDTRAPAAPSTRTDLFSAGLVLLNAATGKQPYASCLYDQFYLFSLVRTNKVLEVLDRESVNILRSNPRVGGLIDLIVMERCSLDEAIEYYERS